MRVAKGDLQNSPVVKQTARLRAMLGEMHYDADVISNKEYQVTFLMIRLSQGKIFKLYRDAVKTYEEAKEMVKLQRDSYKLAMVFQENMKALSKGAGSAVEARMLYAHYKASSSNWAAEKVRHANDLLKHDKLLLNEETEVLKNEPELEETQ